MIVWVEKSNLENFRRNIYNLQGSKCKISEKKIWQFLSAVADRLIITIGQKM